MTDDRADELEATISLLALDLPHPATVAFGLVAQWPAEAEVMISSVKTAKGYKVQIRDPFDKRLTRLRALGMLPVIGKERITSETIEQGWYITGFAELVRRELVMLKRSRG